MVDDEMPNWVHNELEIEGPEEMIKKLMTTVKSTQRPFDFNNIIPYPEQYNHMDSYKFVISVGYFKDSYNCGGYIWCLNNWDTKWNASDPEIQITSQTRILYTFQTAWSPPRKIIKKLSSMFPALCFNLQYQEETEENYKTFEIKNNIVQTNGD